MWLPAPDPTLALVTRIVDGMASDRQILRVDDVVDRCGVEKRALQRLFARYVGVSPKWVIQRYRLHEVSAHLAADPSTKQSALALGLGYADQAHFVRDFRASVGTSPGAYARRVRRDRRRPGGR